MSNLLEKISRLDHSPTDQVVVPPPELVGFVVRGPRRAGAFQRRKPQRNSSINMGSLSR
jgi:hypothetical protein